MQKRKTERNFAASLYGNEQNKNQQINFVGQVTRKMIETLFGDTNVSDCLLCTINSSPVGWTPHAHAAVQQLVGNQLPTLRITVLSFGFPLFIPSFATE